MSDSLSFSGRFLVFFLVVLFARCESKNFAYVPHGSGDPVVRQVDDASEIPSDYVVKAVFDNQINETGWAFLEILANEDAEHDDETKATAAGVIEGVLTSDLIGMHYTNSMFGICSRRENCDRLLNHTSINDLWMNENIEKLGDSDPFWYQVKLYKKQLVGLASGYASTGASVPISYGEMLTLNMWCDLEDLFYAMGADHEVGTSHSSALIKILPDGSDVFVGLETSDSYESMLRIQKKYVLKYKTIPNAETTIKGHTMSFSSYPGIIYSGDNFYITSANLVIQETTIENSNKDLWQLVSPTRQVMGFFRGMVANRLAETGKNWIEIFKKYNSGTHNSQWMVVDYKKFSPETNLEPGFLWVLEQIPGTIKAQDMTSLLKDQGYWPSYSIAYFPEIFNKSGGPRLVKKYGDWFTYDKNPRAQIFKRDQGNINNMDDMYALMRYNDFMHDPLSRCDCHPPYSAENAIAARNDLNKVNGTYPFKALGYLIEGAIDAKITNRDLATTFQFLSVSGPTHNASRGLPPFRWSEVNPSPKDWALHIGHPDLWQFKPLTHTWELGSK